MEVESGIGLSGGGPALAVSRDDCLSTHQPPRTLLNFSEKAVLCI